MTDERYVFVTDVREKKRVARGAFNKRTHAGGGSVKFPSDYLSGKELKEMSGEARTYRLNSPMTWYEFRSMPEDLQILYITSIREKYQVCDSDIFRMMGVSQTSGHEKFKKLGLCKGSSGFKKGSNLDAWNSWIHGISDVKKPMIPDDTTDTSGKEAEDAENTRPQSKQEQTKPPVVPTKGTVTFCGDICSAAETLKQVLGSAYCEITISWEQLIGEKNNG